MASNSKVTSFTRKRKHAKMGKARKRAARHQTTPPFPIHPPAAEPENKARARKKASE